MEIKPIVYSAELPTPESVAKFYLEKIPTRVTRIYELMHPKRMQQVFSLLVDSGQLSEETKAEISSLKFFNKT